MTSKLIIEAVNQLAILSTDGCSPLKLSKHLGFNNIESCVTLQQVQDAIAPPAVTKDVHIFIPNAVPLKHPRCRRRISSGRGGRGSGGGDDGFWDDFEYGSGGGFGGSGDSGGGGGDGWGDSWRDDWRRWRGHGEAGKLFYQLLCWTCFTGCLHHVMTNPGGGSSRDVSTETGSPPFAKCSISFCFPTSSSSCMVGEMPNEMVVA